jgi:hypothetical protein
METDSLSTNSEVGLNELRSIAGAQSAQQDSLAVISKAEIRSQSMRNDGLPSSEDRNILFRATSSFSDVMLPQLAGR